MRGGILRCGSTGRQAGTYGSRCRVLVTVAAVATSAANGYLPLPEPPRCLAASSARLTCPANTDGEIARPELRLVAASPDFRDVYEALYQPVANYLFRRLGDRHDTEDSLHDVFLAAYRAFGRFRDRGVPLRHWVFRIANRAASRRLRRRQRELRALQRGLAPKTQAAAADLGATAADSVRALLCALPRELQDAVCLHYLAELGIGEVAAILRVPPGTVKSRLFRARDLLRAHVARGGTT